MDAKEISHGIHKGKNNGAFFEWCQVKFHCNFRYVRTCTMCMSSGLQSILWVRDEHKLPKIESIESFDFRSVIS